MSWNDLADLPFADALRIHPGDLAPAEVYEGAHFDQLDLDQPDAHGSRFLECAFTRVSIQEGQLRRAQFTDVWLRDVRLISTTLAESGWVGAELTGSVAAGVEAFAARLRRVTLRGCKLDSVNLRDAVLAEVTFDNCVLVRRGLLRRGADQDRLPQFPADQDQLHPRHHGRGRPARRRAWHHR